MKGTHFLNGVGAYAKLRYPQLGRGRASGHDHVDRRVAWGREHAREWGEDLHGVVYADSTAAVAITKRKGSGKLRHINIGMLWLQEKAVQKEFEFAKISGTANPADLMTKHLTQPKCDGFCRDLGLVEGRSRQAVHLQGA